MLNVLISCFFYLFYVMSTESRRYRYIVYMFTIPLLINTEKNRLLSLVAFFIFSLRYLSSLDRENKLISRLDFFISAYYIIYVIYYEGISRNLFLGGCMLIHWYSTRKRLNNECVWLDFIDMITIAGSLLFWTEVLTYNWDPFFLWLVIPITVIGTLGKRTT